MSSKKETSVVGGVGFIGFLTLIFITLKLLGVIDWHWVWVLAPIWINIAVILLIVLIVLIVAMVRHK
jgi:hypothetical protein